MQPESAGLIAGPRRRVAGLRREEVATLSGVGVTWYTMLESGAEMNVSAATLDAVARALRLTVAESDYIHALAFGTTPEPPDEVPDRLATASIGAMVIPAYVCSSQWNVLAWNAAFSRVWAIEPPGGPTFNIVRRMWTPEFRAMHGERFPAFAAHLVAMLRAGKARRFGDPVYRALSTELMPDPVFAAAWASYGVSAPKGSMLTTIDSPAIGRFSYEPMTLVLPDATEHVIVVQVPDSESLARLLAP